MLTLMGNDVMSQFTHIAKVCTVMHENNGVMTGHKGTELEVRVEHQICWMRAFYFQNFLLTFQKMKNILISMFEII